MREKIPRCVTTVGISRARSRVRVAAVCPWAPSDALAPPDGPEDFDEDTAEPESALAQRCARDDSPLRAAR